VKITKHVNLRKRRKKKVIGFLKTKKRKLKRQSIRFLYQNKKQKKATCSLKKDTQFSRKNIIFIFFEKDF
jgi:hypothetical protein